MVHNLLRKQLHHRKLNNCQLKLASHLYELLPESKRQQQLIPNIMINLGEGVSFNFHTIIRKKNRPGAINRS